MAQEGGKPVGERFSQIYLEAGAALTDSERFRTRLSSLLWDVLPTSVNAGSEIQQELGVRVPYGVAGYDWYGFYANAELRDVLDSITIIWRLLKRSLSPEASRWHHDVSRILREENLNYSVDERAGIHFAPDEEYARNRASTIAALSTPRYSGAEAEFNRAFEALSHDAPAPKTAIRSVFEALETVFKLVCDDQALRQLNRRNVEQRLTPLIQHLDGYDATAITVAQGLLDGFCDWIDAAHNYRHGQQTEAPNDPPIGLTFHIVSTGASYLRWLVEIDQAVNSD